RIALGQAHAEGHLREDPFRGAAAGDLGDPADRDAAGGPGGVGGAAGGGAELGVGVVGLLLRLGDQPVQLAPGGQLLVQPGEVGVPADLPCELLRPFGGRGDHGLQVELVLLGDVVRHLGEQFPAVPPRHLAEPAEGGEEVVVAVAVGREVLHGPGTDEGGVEGAVRAGVRGGAGARTARGRDGGHRRGVDAQPVLGGQFDEVLGGHRAGQVVVQVTALGQAAEELPRPARVVADRVEAGGRDRLAGGDRARGRRRGGAGGVLAGVGGGQDGGGGQQYQGAEAGDGQGAGAARGAG